MISSRFPAISLALVIYIATATSLLYGGSLLSKPQTYFRHLSTEDGLSQSTVNCIAQDSQGYLWFGTQDGLNRYDGYNFRVFTNRPTDPTSISDDYIWKVLIGRDGTMWIGTYQGGLNRYDPVTERFTRYQHIPEDSTSLPDNNVSALCEDREGTLWVGTWGGGLCRWRRDDPLHREFVRFCSDPDNPHTLSDNRISGILEDVDGDLWVATWGGLCQLRKVDRAKGVFIRHQKAAEAHGGAVENRMWTLFEDNVGMLWVGTWGGGVIRYDRKADRFSAFRHDADRSGSIGGDFVTSFCEDAKGRLLVGTLDGGVSILDRANDSFERIRHLPHDPSSLRSNAVQSMLLDRSGILWVGTAGRGLSSHSSYRNKFLSIHEFSPSVTGSGGNAVNAICMDSGGALWIGTGEAGLHVLPQQGSRFDHYLHDHHDATSLSSNMVSSIVARKNGDVWVGTLDHGLNRLAKGTRAFQRSIQRNGDAGSIGHASVSTLYEDRGGNLWIGTHGGGLDLYDDADRRFIHHVRRGGDSTEICGNWIRSIVEDSRGNLWIGTWGRGISLLTPENRAQGVFISFRHIPGDSGSLGSNTVLCIVEDDRGMIWLGTDGDGLNAYDRTSNTFAHYSEESGLANDVVYGILPDGRGNLWLSTNKGISRFEVASKTFRNYTRADGLQSEEFNQGAYWRAVDGMMCFGGADGITVFHPDSIRENPLVPSVVISGFTVQEQAILLNEKLAATGRLMLSSDDNALSFECSSLDFVAPEKNRYMYKLVGFDRDWVDAGTRRYARYTHLPPGDFILRIRASNGDGVWNTEGISIPITIARPFWKTWWFLALAIGLIGAIGLLLHRYQVRRLLETERLRVQIASDLHDNLGAVLTRIAVHSERIQTMNDLGTIRTASRAIGQASRSVISSLADIVWSIDARDDTVGAMVDRMRDCMTEVLVSNDVDAQLAHSGLDLRRRIPAPVRQNVFLIFKEAVNNIACHSGARHVQISLLNKPAAFTMCIADDGKGLLAEGRHNGHGIRNMKMRAERIGGEIDVREDCGVRVTLTMRAL